MAQKDRDTIIDRAPYVDVVFGTHNIGSLPALLDRARLAGGGAGRDPRVAVGLPLDAADQARFGVRRLGLDLRRVQQHLHVLHRAGAARQGEGPPARARSWPRSRRWSREGVTEITLLGQNVNAYGVEFGDRQAFSKLLRSCGAIEGLERVRFTSPHPAEFTDDVIEAMAETPNVMHSAAHAAAVRLRPGAERDAPVLPLLEVPRDHRARARRDARRGDHDRHHRGLPRRDRGGLPGDPRRRARRRASPAPSPSSTPSAPAPPPPTLDDQVPPDVVKDRYLRLVGARRRGRVGREQGARRPDASS